MEYVTVILILIIAFLIYKMKKQISQVNYLNDILYIQKQPEKYIEEMNRVLSLKYTEKNKVINTLQKTTGMLYAGFFSEMIETLDKLEDIPKNWMPIYSQNLILALYLNNDKNRGNQELKKAEAVFQDFRKSQYYRELIDIVYAVSDYYNGKNPKKSLTQIAENGANDYRKAFGHYFLGLINKKENKIVEADENFAKAVECGKGSFIEKLSMV